MAQFQSGNHCPYGTGKTEKMGPFLNRRSAQRLLKTRIGSHVISTNYWTQIAVVILAIATTFLSVLMVIRGTLSINAKPKICESPSLTWGCKSVEKWLRPKIKWNSGRWMWSQTDAHIEKILKAYFKHVAVARWR